MIRPRITFADRLSHEFRTPLTVIKEYSALMRDGVVGEISEEHQRMLRVVEDRADDLHNLVDNLLHHSQLDANAQRAVRQRLKLLPVLQRLAARVKDKSEMAGAPFRLDVEAEAEECFADEELLTRSLLNLVQFAIKHRDAETQDLTLHVRAREAAIEFQIGCRLEAAADGGEHADLSTASDLGLSVSVAQQLLHLQFGELRHEIDGGVCRLIASAPAFSLRAIVAAYVKWLASESPSGQTVAALRFLSQGDARALAQFDGMLNYVTQVTDLVIRHGPSEWLLVTTDERTIAAIRDEVDETREHLQSRGADFPEVRAEPLGVWRRDQAAEAAAGLGQQTR